MANLLTMANAATPSDLGLPPGRTTVRLSLAKKSVEANNLEERESPEEEEVSQPTQKTRSACAECLKSLLECAKRHDLV